MSAANLSDLDKAIDRARETVRLWAAGEQANDRNPTADANLAQQLLDLAEAAGYA